ncbi:hypothetical protein BGW38_003053 [Lunasporangiospora selenospora]|uniref:Uncharacterized protein n=1 Tax=Lunasporangiospora selenospora TaxID=979761 RepID=A0A9P6FT94_9FUNG|nr:hypothetical protein BGW38_003053 [Lunasporangiospora selenospora]
MGFGDRDINDPTVVDVLKDPKERVRFRTLAQAKLETLKQRQLDVMVKESSVHLHSLRLVSWASTLNPTRATHPHADDTSVLATVPSPEILSGPGHNLAGAAKLSSIQGGAAGTLTWTIPEDWAYEGEFEIFIPTVAGSGSSSGTGSPVHNSGTGSPQDRNDDGNGNGIVSGGGGTRSQTFWILRDVDTRKHAPQYRLFPMVDSPLGHPHLHHGHTHRGGTMRWRDAGIFYGVAAMMLTLVLIGLGVILALLCLRRRRLYSNIGSQSQSQGLTRILQGGRSGTGRNGGLAGSCSTVTLSSRLGSGYELGPGLGLGMGPDMTNVPGPTWAEDPHHQHQQGHCHSSMPSTLAVMDRSEIRPETESPGIEKGGLSKESKEKDPSLYQDDEDTEAHSPTERPMSAASTIVTLPLYEETTEGVTGRASRNISRS